MTLYEFADSQDISIEVIKKIGSDSWIASLKTEYDFVHNGFNSQISVVGNDPAEALKNLENYLFDGSTLYLQVGVISKTKDIIVRRVSIPTLDRIWNS